MDVADVSPERIIRNPSGKYISSGQRKVVVNLYNGLVKRQLENPDSPRLTLRQTIVEISKSTGGLGQRTVQTTLSEYKNQGTVSSPNKKRKKASIVNTVEEYDKYVIDEYTKDNQKIVLRLPPYHCELNPIEIAWSSVKNYVRTHNNTFKLKDVLDLLKKGVDHVTPEMWTNFVGHVIKEEDKFWNIEHLTDEILDEEPDDGRHILTIGTGDTSSSNVDSD